MASDKPPASRESVEHQDKSIKVRKAQLFEEPEAEAPELRPFADYVDQISPAPLSRGVKAALWATAVLVVLLFLAALLTGRGHRPPRHRRTDRAPARAIAVAATRSDPPRG